MSIRVDIEPLAQNIPGKAQMRIRGWSEETTGLAFKVQRNQDMAYLNGESGAWNSREFWFEIPAAEQDTNGLLIALADDVLDPLLKNINVAYMLFLRNSEGDEASGVAKVSSVLLPSSAGGSKESNQASGLMKTAAATPAAAIKVEPALETVQAPAPEPEPEVVIEPELEPELILEPEPEPEVKVQPALMQAKPAAVKKKGFAKIILIVLLAVLLAAVAWWLYQQKGAGLGDAIANLGADTGACSVANMQQEDELQFIQSCLQEANDSKALLKVIQQAKANDHCGIAQRLYANRAQSGDTLIALAYAKEYDPKFFSANSCFTEANIETAVYWYETVLLNQPDNTEAVQRLEELAP